MLLMLPALTWKLSPSFESLGMTVQPVYSRHFLAAKASLGAARARRREEKLRRRKMGGSFFTGGV